MTPFTYKTGALFAEDVSISSIVEEHGTPLYIYSQGHIQAQFQALTSAMSEVEHLICYSVKANSNRAVIQTLIAEGSGLDIVSGGELYRCLKAGADPQKIVFAGVGKTVSDIEYALRENILFFTVESEGEAARISECAERLGLTGRIAFRGNPDVDPKTHKYISTGKKENKFGMDLSRLEGAYATAARLPGIEIVGLHIHIGSQLLDPAPYAEALERISDFCLTLKDTYPTVAYLDIGGGLGIQYEPGEVPLDPVNYAAVVVPFLKKIGLKVLMEPGRSMVGNAGVLVTEVLYIKKNAFKTFVVVDAAMNDLMRPALYQAYHEVIGVEETTKTVFGDMVGPICESGDFIATDRDLPNVAEGGLVAVLSAGAYASSMASNYNTRGRAAEVMVAGNDSRLVRERETWDDLIRSEENVLN